MFNKISATAIVLSGLAFSTTSQAAEVSVEQLVGSLVSHAAYATKQEISNGLQEAVLTANYTLSLDSEADYYATNVTITDLTDEDTELKEHNSKAE
ncbi:hypothetical protein [Aliiglaciecola litoralis]|uniref:Uncharacterized protein n=1 Tax=Aliiglaciecola litoralis TaxID=582857 RepID=A0ABP3WR72_9ALTE